MSAASLHCTTTRFDLASMRQVRVMLLLLLLSSVGESPPDRLPALLSQSRLRLHTGSAAAERHSAAKINLMPRPKGGAAVAARIQWAGRCDFAIVILGHLATTERWCGGT